jgi:hypothetical protein
MPGVPLGQASYDRADLPKITLRNMYYEKTPANLEDQVALLPRPRLISFSTPGSGPIRGLYRKGGVLLNPGYSGRIIALSGTTLYNVNQNTGTATSIGTISGTATRMSAEGNEDALLLTCGGTLYSTDGASRSTVSLPYGNAWAVDTLNDYFLVAVDSGRFYWSAIGGITFGALDYATAESQPDDLMTLKVIGDELWLLGRLSVEVWQPTGDLDLPFQRIGGRIFGIGITARDTAQKLNLNGVDKLIWLGTDRRVYMTDPNPTRISEPWLEEKLGGATITYIGAGNVGDDSSLNPYAVTYSWQGHDFYVLHVPGVGSFAYDLATGLWDELTSYGRSLFRGQTSAIAPNGQPLLGDDENATIWKLTADEITDGSDDVVFEFTGLLDVPDGPVRCDNVSLDLSAGNTTDPEADPLIQIAWSDDGGNTWTDGEDQSLGRMGERNSRVLWARLGLLRRPGRLFRWRTTQPAVVRTAKYNASLR